MTVHAFRNKSLFRSSVEGVGLGRGQNYMCVLSLLCLPRNLVLFSPLRKDKHRGGEEKLGRKKIPTSDLEESVLVYTDPKLN